MSEPIFLFALAIVATTAIMVARTIAGAISGRGASGPELSRLKEQLEHQAAALEAAEATLASQSAQLAELHERLDFAERMLVQGRDRTALGPGETRG